MAVISISKIQVRRGLQENLPQLAGAEFGWSVDERRLFIGNGTLGEGAPSIGNTEVLTQYSDIFSAVGAYTFTGADSGYTSQTGPTASTPIVRTLQSVLDDHVISVRNFGAIGDGIADDTLALQRAIDEVYPVDYYATVGIRRVLHVPAGIYAIALPLTIPSYAVIYGDGPLSTIIKQTNEFADSVIKVRDSKKQIDAEFGTNLAELPFQIDINNLTLENITDNHTAIIDSTNDIAFNKVIFKGAIAVPATTNTGKAGVSIVGTVDATSRVSFNQCKFTQSTYGILASGNVANILGFDCNFDTLYQGVNLTAASGNYPQNVKVTSSVFNNISKQAVNSEGSSSFTSAFNHYKIVGFGDGIAVNAGTATAPVVTWSNSNNASIGDLFDRTALQSTTYAIIEIPSLASTTLPVQVTTHGTVQDRAGVTVAIPDTIGVETATELTLPTGSMAIIDYTLSKGGEYRAGTIKVTQNSGVATFTDDYAESLPIDISLGFLPNGTDASLSYLVDGTGPVMSAVLNYSVRSFVKYVI